LALDGSSASRLNLSRSKPNFHQSLCASEWISFWPGLLIRFFKRSGESKLFSEHKRFISLCVSRHANALWIIYHSRAVIKRAAAAAGAQKNSNRVQIYTHTTKRCLSLLTFLSTLSSHHKNTWALKRHKKCDERVSLRNFATKTQDSHPQTINKQPSLASQWQGDKNPLFCTTLKRTCLAFDINGFSFRSSSKQSSHSIF
jgi:hypothetical protein